MLTTECFENIALMMPFTFLLMWTAKEKLLKDRRICFASILWYSTKVAFFFVDDRVLAAFPAVGDISAFRFVL